MRTNTQTTTTTKNTLPESVLTKKQTRKYGPVSFREDGRAYTITATVRHDDECGNGHNSFAITGEIRYRGMIESCGCLHEDIAKHFPELAPFIKWHLTSTDGPLHYVANTMYHADEHGPKKGWIKTKGSAVKLTSCVEYCAIEKADTRMSEIEKETGLKRELMFLEVDPKTAKTANLEHSRSSSIWPEATPEQLRDKEALTARLPALMQDFKKAVETLGLKY